MKNLNKEQRMTLQVMMEKEQPTEEGYYLWIGAYKSPYLIELRRAVSGALFMLGIPGAEKLTKETGGKWSKRLDIVDEKEKVLIL